MLPSIPVVCRLTALAVAPFLAATKTDDAPVHPVENGRFLGAWLLLGPVPALDKSKGAVDDELERKAFAADEPFDVATLRPRAGEALSAGGEKLSWRLHQDGGDTINLAAVLGKTERAAAYASAEIEAGDGGARFLGLGSDDAVKVWLNGRLVHERWEGRPVRVDDDIIGVQLEPGRNRLLLKVHNRRGDWGFTCRFVGAEAIAEKLVEAAAVGDLDELKRQLKHGANVNARSRHGLTALQAARIVGNEEAAELLVASGADPDLPMPPPEAVLDSRLQAMLGDPSPAVVVLAAKDGKVLFKKGYGHANIEHRVPATPATKFRIGSVSKQFTAVAILKLKEQGKLDVTDKLSRFLPGYPRGDEVTVHHLLTHTSGIHSYTSKPEFLQSLRLFTTATELIESFKNDPYDFDPGAKWSYNNSGYFLLGHIVEKVSGETYADFLRRELFVPLGMKNSGVHHWSDILENEAHGYSQENGKLQKADNWDMSRAGGAGALYSTVEDLFLWNEAVFGGKVLSPPTLTAALTPVTSGEDEKGPPREGGYGYGWGVGKVRGLKEIAHSGGLHGFTSHLLRIPEESFTAIVLINGGAPPPELNAGAIAAEITQLYLWPRMQPRSRVPVGLKLNALALEAYVGRYDYQGAIMTVTREGEHLYAQLGGQPRHEIFPKAADEFFWKVVEAEVKFTRNKKGDVVKAVHRQGGATIQAARLPEVAAIEVDAAILEQYVGSYDYGGGKAIMVVTREGNQLRAQLTGQPRFEIFPDSETAFHWKVVNARITFVKDQNGKVTKALHEQGGRKFEAPRLK